MSQTERRLRASEAALNRLLEAGARVNEASASLIKTTETLVRAGADLMAKGTEATEPVCLSAEALAKALGGLSKSSIYKAAKRGEIPSHVIGGRQVFHLDEVLAATRRDGPPTTTRPRLVASTGRGRP